MHISRFFSHLSFSSILCLLCLSYSHASYAWDLEDTAKDNPIQVWTQVVKGSNFKAFKGLVKINAPVSKIMSIIRDTENLPKWYYNTEEAKVLKKMSDTETLSYTVTSTPWPVTNRDAVTLASQKPLDNGGFLIELTAKPNAYPLQKDRIRVPKMKGFWKLEPVGKDSTKVTFQIAAEPGGEIPSWLANSMVVEMPFYTLKNLKALAERTQ